MTLPKQLKASDIARDYGCTPRYWSRMAAQGRIPGARQPSGPGGQWLFDTAVFQRWWQGLQREVTAWPGYIVEAKSIGPAPSVRVESAGEAYKRAIEQSLNAVFGNGFKNSTRCNGVISREGHSKTLPSDSSSNT
jgi:hypothetical protein